MKEIDQLADVQQSIEFDVVPVGRNGNTTFRIYTRYGEMTLDSDTFNVADAEKRRKFIKRLGDIAKKENIDFNADDCNHKLNNLAYQESLGHDAPANEIESNASGAFDSAEVLNAFGIDVLGEQEEQAIVIWCRNTKKRWVVKNPGRWCLQEMRQALGTNGDELLWANQGTPAPEGKYTPDDLQRAVALVASRAPQISSGRLMGQGIWMRGEGLLIVNGAAASVFQNEKVSRVSRPKFKNEILDFNCSKSWTNHPTLIKNVNAMTRKKAKTIVRRAEEFFQQWNWDHRWDHRIISLLIPATIIQNCWTWRPLVSIIGASDTGKTTLLSELVVPLLGSWTIAADRSSEAGLRQRIAHDSSPVVIDEFDKYKQRQQVLELFRTSSRGGTILKGTANQEGQQFGLRHLPWFAAIESGDIWGQDRNRFIRFELHPPEERGVLTLPSADELQVLGQELVAVAVWAAPAVVKLADRIKRTQVAGVHGRLVESFSVPAAMDAVICDGHDATDKRANKALRAFLRDRTSLVDQGEPDEVQLLRDIFAATLTVRLNDHDRSGTATRTIAQALFATHSRGTNSFAHPTQDTEPHGLRIFERRGSGNIELFILPNVVRQKLLAETRWRDTRIDQVLLRLPGAERTQQRCGGQKPYGVSLPWPGCLDSIDGEDSCEDSVTE